MNLGEIMTLTSCQLKRLEKELYKATLSGVCQWQLMTPECITTSTGEYGVFLVKRGNFTRISVYHSNKGCIADLEVHNLNNLFYKALKQAETKNKMNVRELVGKNSDSLTMDKQRSALFVRISKVLHQP